MLEEEGRWKEEDVTERGWGSCDGANGCCRSCLLRRIKRLCECVFSVFVFLYVFFCMSFLTLALGRGGRERGGEKSESSFLVLSLKMDHVG